VTRTARAGIALEAVFLAAAVAVAGGAAGCRRGPAGRGKALVVFAASSLREVLPPLAAEMERAHPGAEVALQLAGSQELRVQIEHGARADVFLSADDVQMDLLRRAGRVGEPMAFAGNELAVVTPAADPAGFAAFGADAFWHLPEARRIAIGAPEVPVGRYTERMLERAAAIRGPEFRDTVMQHVVTRELNVRQTLAKAVVGEVDAAIVYRTDALAAGASVRTVAVPPAVNVVTTYELALVRPNETQTAHPLGPAFVALVLSEAGQKRLAAAGFTPPGAVPATAASPNPVVPAP